ncbi:phenylpyruvate tautomerase PptA (4-oxalocrotonate tautomerase family) [Paenibacillus sp. 4624]|jgi:phenylpyruvate tautomerase PptA (4-oxalocrotonate tautomerase family)|uniref:DUF1904 family protein n=1 Tax=Paenibacillus amylolyticus TaxID=1451 RepID=A0A5M9WLZ9_PAEAM|nr:DUF1904 family protein [Paenibacillus amylolyticus]KAA8782591.1 DUF1904 family protein [Paenibacillus amylolyticus]
MPFIRFKGFTGSKLEEVVPQITEQMALITHIPQERMKAERHDVQALTPSPASIEILMFQRDQEIHDRIASSMQSILEKAELPDVHIFFNILSPHLYYKKGKPLTDYRLD